MLTVRDTSDAVGGNTALLVQALAQGDGHVTGIATLAAIVNFSLQGGVAFTDQPPAMHGFYKFYKKEVDDTAFIGVYFKDSGGNYVGGGSKKIYDQVSVYTKFDIPLYYSSAPDTMAIIIISDSVGAVLFVDSLTFSYPVSVTLLPAAGIANYVVFPNPASDYLFVQISDMGECSLTLVNSAGEAILHQHVSGCGLKKISLQQVPDGVYVLQIKNAMKNISRKVVVRR